MWEKIRLSYLYIRLSTMTTSVKSRTSTPSHIYKFWFICIFLVCFSLVGWLFGGAWLEGFNDVYIKKLVVGMARGTPGGTYHCMQPQSILYIFRPPYQCTPLIILGGHHQSNQRAIPTGYSPVKPVPTLSRHTVNIRGGLP